VENKFDNNLNRKKSYET